MKLLDTLKKQLDALLPPPLAAAPVPAAPQATAAVSRRTTSRVSKRPLAHPQAYSHGLEKIYTLETIDVATVKVLKKSSKSATASPSPASTPLFCQGEFDFGPPWRQWIPPCFLEEPLQVLELSKQATTALIAHGLSSIGSLLAETPETLMTIRSLGQGHIDEVIDKLKHHINGRSTLHTTTIEWGAWLRSLLASVPPRAAKVLLDSYQLEDVLTISRSMHAEVRRLSREERERQLLIANEALDSQRDMILERLGTIVMALVIPWMRKRGNIATSYELSERLEQLSADLHLMEGCWRLLSHVLKSEETAWQWHLCRVAPGVYTIDGATAAEYREVVAVATSYFYRPGLSYPLDDIVVWVARELGRQWRGPPLSQIAKILRYAPEWRVRRGASGGLMMSEKIN